MRLQVLTEYSHHIKGIRPALECMTALGFEADACLKGTGLNADDIENAAANSSISLDQEFRLYENLLELSTDPLIGLELGKYYRLESYGLLGYAMLSASTIGEALRIAADFGVLTFSLFRFGFCVTAEELVVQFSHKIPIPDHLVQVFSDRDLSAALFGARESLGRTFEAKKIRMMHSAQKRAADYEAFFGCDVEFSCATAELVLDASILGLPMPNRDVETSLYCQQQCKKLVDRFSHSDQLLEQVRNILIARPGCFPPIEEVAKQMQMSPRTLRRRLSELNNSFQTLLNETRFQLAKEYLQSNLPLEQIAELLGYSEAGNFSHAFKRWQGCSPMAYRKHLRSS